MSRNSIALIVFLAGLLAVGWVGASYLGNHALAASVVAVIAACYLVGAFELLRYGQATATLQRALPSLEQAGSDPAGWLGRLAPGLRNSVRLRLEGERVGLPAPALTPYLVGLLVLLGMLGTLLGMVATLRGTGLALESAANLEAIRSSLAAPVKGLGFAFGTSIAGVATSAALGLLSVLARRERTRAVQQLDAGIAAQLGQFSPATQRRESFRLLQEQQALMPVLVERLHTLANTLERQQQAAAERQLADQQSFRQRSEAAHAQLAASLQQALHAGIAEQAHAVGAALQPVVDTTMAGLAAQSERLHAAIEQSVRRQLDGLDAAVQGAADAARDSWHAAVAEQQRGNAALAENLQQALRQCAAGFEQGTTALLDGVAARQAEHAARTAAAWDGALTRQQAAHETLAERNAQAQGAAAAAFAQRSDAMIDALQHSHGELQRALQARDAERLAQWRDAFAALTDAFGQRWEQGSAQLAAQQQQVCATLEQTAQVMGEQAQAQARATLAEIARLVDTAAEAPRAAAEVVAELRQKLSDSLQRDTATLEERGHLLETVQTLLDAINHAATEQRGAIDALVSTSAELLERVGGRFSAQVEGEAGRLDQAAAHVTGSALEVASLGEAFGGAVQSFGESTASLGERLLAIEAALDKSLARSDEQLAYYAAQAREVIELSMLSQKQIIGELQQLAGTREGAAA